MKETTQDLLFSMAKRSAKASDRKRFGIDDLFVGLYEMSRSDQNEAHFRELFEGPVTQVCWPEEVTARHGYARRVAPMDCRAPMSYETSVEPCLRAGFSSKGEFRFKEFAQALIQCAHPTAHAFRRLNRDRLQETMPTPDREGTTDCGVAQATLPGDGLNVAERILATQRSVERLRVHFGQRVRGQREAVETVVRFYQQARLSPSVTGPRGILTFLGPPGVGKTMTGELFAEGLSLVEGHPVAYRRFDMSTYSTHHSHEQLFGSNRVYTSSNPGVLTGFVKDNPASVLLFDEIEKAHPAAIQSLLAILDKGVVMDAYHQEEISFNRTWILFTTNLGSARFAARRNAPGEGSWSREEALDILASADAASYLHGS